MKLYTNSSAWIPVRCSHLENRQCSLFLFWVVKWFFVMKVDDYFVLNSFSSDSVLIIFHPYQRISVQVSRDYPTLKIWKNPFQILKGYSFSPERALFFPEIMYFFLYSTCLFFWLFFKFCSDIFPKSFKRIHVRTYNFFWVATKRGIIFFGDVFFQSILIVQRSTYFFVRTNLIYCQKNEKNEEFFFYICF